MLHLVAQASACAGATTQFKALVFGYRELSVSELVLQ